MKKFLGLALFSFTLPALADVPPPPATTPAFEITLKGADAAELGASLDGQYQVESMVPNSSSSVKVFYSSTGLTQIVCRKTRQLEPTQKDIDTCSLQKSKDGKALKKFIIHRISG